MTELNRTLRISRQMRWLYFALAVGTATSCSNVLSDLANKSTDPAKLYQAKLDLNARLYTEAINGILSMSTAGQAVSEVQVLLASAYAGRCGLDALTLVQNISKSSSSNLFAILFSGFAYSNLASVTDCRTARSILVAQSSLSVDGNLLLALVSLSTIGATLGSDYGKNQTGSVDTGVGWCQTSQAAYPALPAPSPMSDSDVTDIFVNVAYALQGIAAAGNSVAGGTSTTLTTFCATLPAGSCSRSDPSLYTAAEIKYLRGVIASVQGVGIGLCSNSIALCACL